MPRLQTVDRSTASVATQKMLDGIEKKLGMLPNVIATIAQSGSAVQAYLGLSQALSGGEISGQLREQIALTVAQANQCEYCLAAHSAIGSSLGLSEDQILDARAATSTVRKTEAALQFARRIVEGRGSVSDKEVDDIRSAGYSEPEIIEVIANVALNTFTNYISRAAQLEIDFPEVAEVAVQ